MSFKGKRGGNPRLATAQIGANMCAQCCSKRRSFETNSTTCRPGSFLHTTVNIHQKMHTAACQVRYARKIPLALPHLCCFCLYKPEKCGYSNPQSCRNYSSQIPYLRKKEKKMLHLSLQIMCQCSLMRSWTHRTSFSHSSPFSSCLQLGKTACIPPNLSAELKIFKHEM